jgi:LuxR family transcriptional regulator, activator of conjugal transfer of Ti plasmids
MIRLSHRELECLTWTAKGKTTWDIAMILEISEHTVNYHIKNAMKKLDAHSRTVAVVKAVRFGLIDPTGIH